MNLFLPIDSRLSDTQGFVAIKDGRACDHLALKENYPYARKGFRGACAHNGRLYVCNSFSVKIYRLQVPGGKSSMPGFELERQVVLPDWLMGRGANADLHYPFIDSRKDEILIANSYMDCVERFTLQGDHLGRKFLWEISPEIHDLARKRDPRAADLCHINYLAEVGESGELLATLGNLNGTGIGAVMSLDTGEMLLRDLGRPHDGVWSDGNFFITETSKFRLLVYRDIRRAADLIECVPEVVDLSQLSGASGKIWLRGLLVTKDRIYVGCSQFQDRTTGESGSSPTQVLVIDRLTAKIEDQWPVLGIEGLEKPVIYSLLDMDEVLAMTHSLGAGVEGILTSCR